MASINILKFPVSSPADTSPLTSLQQAGYTASQILGVVGKTEGNGCVNDFSRTLSAHVWDPLIPSTAISIFSGGTEGVLTPHVTFFLTSAQDTGLLASVRRTREFQPWEIGSDAQAAEVERAVREMMAEGGVESADVRMVLVKCPLLTSEKMERCRGLGRRVVTGDTYESMAKSRFASAVGVGAALGEIEGVGKGGDGDAVLAGMRGAWSAKASCSSGAELEDCHILMLASSPRCVDPSLKALSTCMGDAIDAASILGVLGKVKEEGGQVVQVFAKAEPDPRGLIRGKRHTMNTDSDLQGTRHARAAVGGLIAGLVGDTEIYVSGGAEGQGPVGGGSLCLVYRV